jgi:hypothetical protein
LSNLSTFGAGFWVGFFGCFCHVFWVLVFLLFFARRSVYQNPHSPPTGEWGFDNPLYQNEISDYQKGF